MPEADYQELLYDIGQRFAAAGVPFQAQIELTKRCVLDCVHCYVDHDPKLPELSRGELFSLLDDLAAWGVFDLTLTGGEPLLHPQFWEILAHAKALGFYLRLFTSGAGLDAQAALRLKALNLGEVHLSVYSADPELHDAITRRKGSQAQTLAAIRALKDAGLRVFAKVVLFKANLQSFSETLDVLKNLGVDYFVDTNLLPAEGAARDPLALRLSEEELAGFLADPDNTARLWRGDRIASLAEVMAKAEKSGRVCEIGRTAIFVDAVGQVMPCAVHPPIGSIRTTPIRELWQNDPSLTRLRALTHETLTSCPSCAYRDACSPCPGFAVLEHGDPQGCNSGSLVHARALSKAKGS